MRAPRSIHEVLRKLTFCSKNKANGSRCIQQLFRYKSVFFLIHICWLHVHGRSFNLWLLGAHHRQKMEYFQKQYHFYLSKLFLTQEKWIFGQLVSSNGIFVKKKSTCFQPFLTNIFLWILGINLRIILTVWIPIVVILSREILAFIQIAAFYTHRQSLSSINNQFWIVFRNIRQSVEMVELLVNGFRFGQFLFCFNKFTYRMGRIHSENITFFDTSSTLLFH